MIKEVKLTVVNNIISGLYIYIVKNIIIKAYSKDIKVQIKKFLIEISLPF